MCPVCQKRNLEKQYKKGRVVGLRKTCSYCRRTPEQLQARRDQAASKVWVEKGYRVNKKDSCEKCGFRPEHPCQLDVDHIDGNHKNNDILNLQTLCANCHRLKTWVNREGAYAYHKGSK